MPSLLSHAGRELVNIVHTEFGKAKWDASAVDWTKIADRCKALIGKCTSQSETLGRRIREKLMKAYELELRGQDPSIESGGGNGESPILVRLAPSTLFASDCRSNICSPPICFLHLS